MNRSLLEDGDYIKDITEKIPMWLAEGRDALSDKRKGRERNEKENKL